MGLLMHKAVLVAINQAKLAYQFAPNSYTFSALSSLLDAARATEEIDWINDTLAWNMTETEDENAEGSQA